MTDPAGREAERLDQLAASYAELADHADALDLRVEALRLTRRAQALAREAERTRHCGLTAPQVCG